MDVNPLLVEPQRVPARSFVAKPYFLVDMPGAWVEGVNLKSYPMKTKLVEAVPDNQLGRLTAKPPAAAFGAKESTEAAGAIQLVPVVEHDFSNHRVRRLIDHGEDETVIGGAPAFVRLAEVINSPRQRCLAAGVHCSGQNCSFGILEHPMHYRCVLSLNRSQFDALALDCRLMREDRGHAASLSETLGTSSVSRSVRGSPNETESTAPDTRTLLPLFGLHSLQETV